MENTDTTAAGPKEKNPQGVRDLNRSLSPSTWINMAAILLCIFFGYMYYNIKVAYNRDLGSNGSVHNQLAAKDAQLADLQQKFANIIAEDYPGQVAKLKAKIDHLEWIDRRCIGPYIKSRYSRTPTLLSNAIANSVVDLCEKHQMPVALILGIMEAESAFNPYAKSAAGARGLMQVMFKTWSKELGIEKESDLHEIRQGIEYGILVLKQYIAQSEGNLKKALWKYNGRAADHNKYANIVFTHVGRYILHRCRTSFKMEDFTDEEPDKKS